MEMLIEVLETFGPGFASGVAVTWLWFKRTKLWAHREDRDAGLRRYQEHKG